MADVPNTKAVRRALRGSMEDALRLAAEDPLGKAVAAAPVKQGTPEPPESPRWKSTDQVIGGSGP